MVMLSNQGKTNITGRIDQCAIFGQRRVEQCESSRSRSSSSASTAISSTHVQISSRILTTRTTGTLAAEIGTVESCSRQQYRSVNRRQQTSICLITVSLPHKPLLRMHRTDLDAVLTYSSQQRRLTSAFVAVGIDCSNHTTHAARATAARNIALNGAEESDNRAHGGWSSGAAFRDAYQRELPTGAMPVAAGFDAKEGLPNHFISRDTFGT